jgi:hypothetical protein
MGNEGRTYQKVPSAWVIIFCTSLVSLNIQIIPKTEIKGSDAIKLPKSGSLLEISEMITMITAVTVILITYQSIGKHLENFKIWIRPHDQ